MRATVSVVAVCATPCHAREPKRVFTREMIIFVAPFICQTVRCHIFATIFVLQGGILIFRLKDFYRRYLRYLSGILKKNFEKIRCLSTLSR